MYVFVYGSLKKGYGNNRLLQNAIFIDKGITLKPYVIYGAGGFPVVFDTEKKGHIAGEVYDVTPAERARLDGLEGYPYMYHRKKVMVVLDETGHRVACQMYVGTVDHWQRNIRSLQQIQPDQNGVCTWNR